MIGFVTCCFFTESISYDCSKLSIRVLILFIRIIVCIVIFLLRGICFCSTVKVSIAGNWRSIGSFRFRVFHVISAKIIIALGIVLVLFEELILN